MSRFVLGVAAALVAVCLSPAALATAPRLAVSETSPFTVTGAHFKPHERVRVYVSTLGAVGTHTVAAGARGGFTTKYTQISLGPCASYIVRAIGSLGSRVTVRSVPECANGPTE